MERFTWVGFYKELAVKLRAYRHNRQELVQKVYRIYERARLNMPKMDKDGNLVDIDPFTFYSMFNKNLTFNNRLSIVRAVKDELGIEAELPKDFAGIPTVQALKATYYPFADERGENDIDNLWGLFEAALVYAERKDQESKDRMKPLFDYAINIKGDGASKITIGLYWIQPEVFLSLDSVNKQYI